MNFWYQPKLTFIAFLLIPLSWLFSFIAKKRRRNRNQTPYTKPVVVVGNIAVGGTGKTPTLIWLVNVLRTSGIRVAIVSRGYKARPNSPFPLLLRAEHASEEVGDEPLLLYQRTGVPVVIDPNRHRAVTYLCSEFTEEIDVILSDDGMQHYAMYRDIEIVMIDPVRGVGNGRLLPAGPLREPYKRAQSSELILAKSKPGVSGIAFTDCAEPVYGDIVNATGQILTAKTIRLMSGIGNFDSFRQSVLSLGFNVIEEKIFNDHEKIPDEVLSDDSCPILMTEKDYIKLSHPKSHLYYLPFELKYSQKTADRLIQKLQDLINEKNRHHSRSL